MATTSTKFWLRAREGLVKASQIDGLLEAEPSARRCRLYRRCKRATSLRRDSRRGFVRVKWPLESQEERSYLDLSDGAGGDLVVLQRRRRDGPAAVEGLGERRHLGSGRDLHAGQLGGVQLLEGAETTTRGAGE